MKTIIYPEYAWWPEIDQTLYCKCKAVFRGRAKLKSIDKDFVHWVDRNCPNCGNNIDLIRTSSDPEKWTLS